MDDPKRLEPDTSDSLADARLAAIIDSSFDAIVSKNLNGIITSWNAAAERMFGYTAAEAVGQSILMLIPDDRRSEEHEIIERIRRGERVQSFETIRRRKDGSSIEVSLTISPIIDRTGRLVGASKIARDISATKESERRIALLLREVHHRVKNNLQLVVSLVQLQPMDPQVKSDLRNRIRAMAAVHDHLHRPGSGGSIDLAAYVSEIVESTNRIFGNRMRIVFEAAESVLIDADVATPIGLIVNELVVNSNKYAFPDRAEGTMRISVRRSIDNPARAELRIANDGVAFDAAPDSNAIGVRLIRNLAAGLDAAYVLDGAHGLDFRVTMQMVR